LLRVHYLKEECNYWEGTEAKSEFSMIKAEGPLSKYSLWRMKEKITRTLFTWGSIIQGGCHFDINHKANFGDNASTSQPTVKINKYLGKIKFLILLKLFFQATKTEHRSIKKKNYPRYCIRLKVVFRNMGKEEVLGKYYYW